MRSSNDFPEKSNLQLLQRFFASRQARISGIGAAVVVFLLVLVSNAPKDLDISRYNPVTQGSCALTRSCHKRAISTILTGPSFLPGIVTLSYSISIHAPNVDKLLIVPNDWSSQGITPDQIQMLERIGFKIKYFDDLPLPTSADRKDQPNDPRFADLLLKLQAWSLFEYPSIALLDADVLLNDSLQYPFDLLEASTANLAAVSAPSPGPDDPFFDLLAGHFNAGILFLKPDPVVYATLVDRSSRREEYKTIKLAEQSFLNTQYCGSFVSLPVRYNTANTGDRKDYFKRFVVDANWDFAILHFLGNLGNKPWSGVVNPDKDVQKGVDMWKTEYEKAKELYGLHEADMM